MTKTALGIWSGRKTKGGILSGESMAAKEERGRQKVEWARWHPRGPTLFHWSPSCNRDASVLRMS